MKEDIAEGTMRVWRRWTVAQQLWSARLGDENQDLVRAVTTVLARATSVFRSSSEGNDYLG